MQDPQQKRNSISNVARRVQDSFVWLLRFAEKQLLEFARDSRRDPEEFRKPFMYRYGLEITIAVAIFAFFVTTFGPTILFLTDRWTSAAPLIPLDASRWKILYDDGGECGTFLSESCVGHPASGKLWASTDKLSDDDHSVRVQAFKGKKFWAGLELTPEEVRTAFEKQAPVVELGLFNAGYRVWVNGVLADEGNGRDFMPAKTSLSQVLLKDGFKIRLSIEVDHYLGSRLPIWLPARFGGLFNSELMRAHSHSWLTFTAFSHLVMIAWAILISTIFFLLWLYVPRKAEYFFFSLYVGIFCLMRLSDFGPFIYATPRDHSYQTLYFLVAAEGALACLLGAVYSRASKRYLFWVIGTELLISVSCYLSAKNSIELYWFKDALEKFNTPLMFALGASFCFAQMYLLSVEQPKLINSNSLKIRKFRLAAFGSLSLIFAIVFFVQGIEIMSATPQFVERSVQLVLLVLIALLLLQEFSDREKQFEVVQRSPFHDPLGGPSSEVFGYLVSIDLVSSSPITNFSAEKGTDIRPISAWNSAIGEVMARRSGFKVADEGDGLKVFFHSSPGIEELRIVLESLARAEQVTLLIEEEFRARGLMPENSYLRFRAGVVWGGIKPIWRDFVGVKTAEWEDANGVTTFKDVTRIMDSEKQLRPTPSGRSMVVLKADQTSTELLGKTFEKIVHAVRDVGPIELYQVDLANLENQAANSAA